MSSTLVHTFMRRAAEHGDRVALHELRAGGAQGDVTYTWQQWHDRARSFARNLQQAGCRPGECIAILAGNTALWPIVEMGAQMAGLITVGIYPTSAPVQVQAILEDCAPRVVVVDSAIQLAKIRAIRRSLPALRAVVAATQAEDAASFDEWTHGPALSVLHEPEPSDIALLIYTSGSTGEPKGARISHRYLMASAESIARTLDLSDADSSLSFLPFCHAAERVFGLYTRIHCGMTAGLVADHTRIWDAARTFEPTLFGGLPRFYEKLFELLVNENPQDRTRKLAGFVGNRVRVATSGGATLPAEVTAFLRSCGLEVVGAYGLTEHLCVAMHRPRENGDSHSVGQAMPGTQVSISDSGEILVRVSDLTFSGYHGMAAETRAAFTPDGKWLRTGDLGTVDANGFIYVTGREKELIALSTGKKVAPLPIEARLLEFPMISQAVVVGENRKYVSALVVLRRSMVESWAREQDLNLPYHQLLQHPLLNAIVQHAVDHVNANLSNTEQIKRFALLPNELSVERNELTPTLKIRRNVIVENYRDQLESLYQVSA